MTKGWYSKWTDAEARSMRQLIVVKRPDGSDCQIMTGGIQYKNGKSGIALIGSDGFDAAHSRLVDVDKKNGIEYIEEANA